MSPLQKFLMEKDYGIIKITIMALPLLIKNSKELIVRQAHIYINITQQNELYKE